ncbi:DUF4190 domain-containing protein [Actinokineospora sp. PR83]|uniref:DUF4190 domain-containing protein n=1 Tax=Actinokineospora sp. PR83 TaxID=2884908 RepID=UPI001F303364|nr:DUF4190 domain-containing protein [Actinokineospora sp. PR83]MCG8919878.1 DUF4190 domain-containing protein [Actinokineospora sp. PR83]
MTYPAPTPVPAPSKRKKWPWIVGGIVALIVVGSVATSNKDDNTTRASGPQTTDVAVIPPAAPAAAAPVAAKSTVVYKVTGTAKDTTVMYTTMDGGSWSSSTEQDVPLPWEKTVAVEGGLFSGGSLIVTTGMKGGQVTCSVVVDGKEAKTAQASGEFASASCSGF